MTREAVVALRAEHEEVLRLFRSLTGDELEMPSGCEGWRVRDVLAHLASLFHPTRTLIEGARGEDAERLNDLLVDERRELPFSEVVSEYDTWSRRALRVMDVLQRRPLASIPFRLGEMGRYPIHLLANASVFDHYTHLRIDVLEPFGPVSRPPLPSDPLRLRPVVFWMLALVPNLCAGPLAGLDEPVGLRLHGPGGGEWVVERVDGDLRVRPDGAETPTTVVSTTEEFVVWSTKRQDWRDRDVEIEGDADLGRRFLDAVRLY